MPTQRVHTHLSLLLVDGMEHCATCVVCFSQWAPKVDVNAVSAHRLSLSLRDDKHLYSLDYHFFSPCNLARNVCCLWGLSDDAVAVEGICIANTRTD